MLLLASQASGSKDYSEDFLNPIPADMTERLLRKAAHLLQVRGQKTAADLLASLPFRVMCANNHNGDEFSVLQAVVPATVYEATRSTVARDSTTWEQIRRTLCDDCDYFIRIIACELADHDHVVESSEHSRPTAALESSVDQLGKLMTDIATRERSLRDAETNVEFGRLRKELMKLATLAAVPEIVERSTDGWVFWGIVSEGRATYAERRAYIQQEFFGHYERILRSPSKSDLGAYFLLRDLRLGAPIGEGGSGVVHRADHVVLNVPRAIKLFHPRFYDGDRQALQRFAREAELLGGFSHPNIVRFYDAGVAIGRFPFLVTELVDGEDLEEALKNGRKFEIAEVCELCCQILDALGAAHAAKVVHRDVKPRNVVWTGGRATLLDFGAGGIFSEVLTSRITTTAQGTPGYMDPALLDNPKLLDPRVDLFSVGAMAHRLVTGRAINASDPGLYFTGSSASDGFVAVLRRAMVPIDQRFPDAGTMATALRGVWPGMAVVRVTTSEQSGDGLHPTLLTEDRDLRSILRVGAAETPQRFLGWARAELLAPCRAGVAQMAERVLRVLNVLIESARVTGGHPAHEWADEQDVLHAMTMVVGLLAPAGSRELPTMASAAVSRAAHMRWLEEDEYDEWHPGMESGTGRKTRLSLTPLGRKVLRERGTVAPPRDPAGSPGSPAGDEG